MLACCGTTGPEMLNLNIEEPDMVATRGTDEIVKFVTGNERIDPHAIGDEAWVKTLRGAIEVLHLGSLKGMKPLLKILGQDNPDDPDEVLRTVPAVLPRLSFTVAGERKELSQTAFLLPLTEIGEFAGSWSEAYRKTPVGKFDFELEVAFVKFVLLARSGHLYLVSTRWNAIDQLESSGYRNRSPASISYTIDHSSIPVERLDDKALGQLIADNGVRMALRMLLRLYHVQQETSAQNREALDKSVARTAELAGYVKRLGLPT